MKWAIHDSLMSTRSNSGILKRKRVWPNKTGQFTLIPSELAAPLSGGGTASLVPTGLHRRVPSIIIPKWAIHDDYWATSLMSPRSNSGFLKKRLDQTRLVNLPSSRAARSAILTSSRSNNYHSYLHSKTLRSSKVWRTTRKCLQHSRLWQGWRQHLRVKYMKHKSTNAGNSASLQMTMNTSFSRVRARAQILDQRRV